jgi:flagellar biosynthesis GTPase FlhF
MSHINYPKYKAEILNHIKSLVGKDKVITEYLCEQKSKEVELFFDKTKPNYTKKAVFIGHVGAGKTTAICYMLGLTFEKKTDI